jgi:hypothetical protein
MERKYLTTFPTMIRISKERQRPDYSYFGEFSTFIDAVENPTKDNKAMVLSSFEDAVKTYDLTWRIRKASEESGRELTLL